jgi:hypothetical protein
MAKLIHYHRRYQFETPAEEKSAQLLSEGNIRHIENQLWFEQNRRNNIDVDASDPQAVMKFIQEEAEIKGAMRAFQFLLDTHSSLVSGLESDQIS